MSKKANPALIGTFVVGAIVLAVVAVLIIAGDALTQNKREFVAVFEGSVKGLRVGSNVLFRGVRVGYVTDIKLIADEENQDFIVPVIFEFVPTALQVLSRDGTLRPVASREDTIGYMELVDVGLRAQLETESLITGQLLIELDLHPDTPAVFRAKEFDTPEIPTIPSQIQSILRRAKEFATDLEGQVDFGAALADLASAIKGLDQFINAEDTQALSSAALNAIDELSATLRDMRALVRNADDQLGPAIESFGPAIKALEETLDEAEKTLALVRRQLESDSDIAVQVLDTLDELERAARSARVFLDYLDRQPEALLKGKKNEK